MSTSVQATPPPRMLQPRYLQHHGSRMHHHASNEHSGSGPGVSARPRMSYTPYRGFPRPPPPGQPGSTIDPNAAEYDGRRLRKSLIRKTVDYNSAIIKYLQNRVWQRDHRDRRALEPDYSYAPDTVPPAMLQDNSTNSVTTRYVKSATNKMRCPIFTMAWTPEGRRLVTGASSGEFTLWNGLTFNFETILQAHDSPVRSMVWSHNDVWMVTGDHGGYVKYWQSNMNNVKMFQAHKEAIRGLTFSPFDTKFASCSDDGTVRVWDFLNCYEEQILRGHGADVKCVDWHPNKGLLVSGSKDNQQPIKLWDPKAGIPLTTLHAHKSTVMDIRWNKNGNWLLTASRDHLVKLFDIRKLSTELQIFRGHKKEASCISWHPIHQNLFASGGSDGSILFWNVGCEKEVGSIEAAHDNIIWTLAWHPVGHILTSGSNDHTSKFWTRQKPGDIVRDKAHAFHDHGDFEEREEEMFIPGMAPEDRVEQEGQEYQEIKEVTIPGLDLDDDQHLRRDFNNQPKKPYAKPIQKKFLAIWNESSDVELTDDKESRNPLLPKPSEHQSAPHPPPPDSVFNPNIGFGPMGAMYNEHFQGHGYGPGPGGPRGQGPPGPFWNQGPNHHGSFGPPRGPPGNIRGPWNNY